MDYELETESKLSRINSAGLINLRLHQLAQDCHTHARKGQYAQWNADLDRLFVELGGDVDEGSEDEKKYNKINEELTNVAPIIDWTNHVGFEGNNLEKTKLQLKQYSILIKKELFLKRLQNKQGKGTAYEDDAMDYLSN